MAPTIRLDIITPERTLLQEPVEMLVAPAIDGEIGVLKGHFPLVTALQIGPLRFRREGEEKWVLMAVSGEGIMEVLPDRVSILAGAAEFQHEIDVERAKQARERAEKRLNGKDDKANMTRAEAALQRALNRLRIAKYMD